ncbi:hypothetical protein JOC37_002380 [Desulfohalotomaculum tongense]|uniref:hypothetical protein n=1 Tax=Desulforadius tongensis TaxID=1216062 RepID=UPI0019585E32|nr:hypothetical protein [Desulforadius tongensis]MBM7855957.1 hypothetical protein [Desulforadius tongensis]
MKLILPIILVTAAFMINIPLGLWRASVKKFGPAWFLSVHLSVPFIIFLRIKMGLPVMLMPLTICSAAAGQYYGGKIGVFKSGRNTGAE